MTETIEIVNTLMARWEQDDIDGVLALLDDNVEYHYIVGRKPLVNKAEVRKFLETFGQGQTEKRWRISNHAVTGDKLLLEGVDDYISKDGVRVQLAYMGVFEFRNGLIFRWRDYVDTAMAEKAHTGVAAPDYLQKLIDA